MSTLRERKKLYSHEKISELLLPLAFNEKDDLFYMDDNSIGFGYVMSPLYGVDESIVTKAQAILNQNYNSGAFLQFNFIASPDITNVMDNLVSSRRGFEGLLNEDTDDLLMNSIYSRRRFLEKHTKEPLFGHGGPLIKNYVLVISAKIPCSGSDVKESDEDEAKTLKSELEKTLQTCGYYPQALTGETYTRIMSNLINWSDSPSWHEERRLYDNSVLLKDQLVDYSTEINVHKKGLKVGNKEVRTLSIKRLPQTAYLPANHLFLGDMRSGNASIKENYMITATIYYQDADKMKQKHEIKRQKINYSAYGPMSKFMPRMGKQKESYDVLFESVDNGDRIVKINWNICIFCDNKDKASSAVAGAKTYFRTLGYQLMQDEYFTLAIFLNQLPFNADKEAITDLFRYRTMSTKHALQLLPLIGDWRGGQSPVMQFVSRNGQLVNFDIFESTTSYSAVVAAESGSGKSYLTNYLIGSYLSYETSQCFVIDIGGSYKKLCSALHGSYLEFTPETTPCLNPFDIVKDYKDEADVLIGIISSMAMPTEKMSDYQTSGLMRILGECWQKHERCLTIDILADALKADDDPRVTDLGFQLFPFTTAGEYGKYFSGPNNVQFDNRFVCLDLEQLKGRKILQRVVLMILIYQIQQAMFQTNDVEARKLCILDESWDLLLNGGPDVGNFLESGNRRYRKVGGSQIMVLQSINDLYKSDNGVAIAENSPNKFLLGQRPETINMLKDTGRIDLSEGGYELLKTVHTLPGEYSEIFIHSPIGQGIVRLVTDRYSQLLYTTKPDELAALKVFTDKGMNVHNAIVNVMSNEGSLQLLDKKAA